MSCVIVYVCEVQLVTLAVIIKQTVNTLMSWVPC